MKQQDWDWKCHKEQEDFLLDILDNGCQENEKMERLKEALLGKTSTRLFDWVDHFILPKEKEKEVKKLGFKKKKDYFIHPGALLPKITFNEEKKEQGIAIKVDEISDFLFVRGMERKIEGEIFSPFRKAKIYEKEGGNLFVIERRGTSSCKVQKTAKNYQKKYLKAEEIWKTRKRRCFENNELMKEAFAKAKEMIDLVGRDVAAYLILSLERDYWERKNRAGQWQKNRQDSLGMGWANHDHHTFRSSRASFQDLVKFFEIIGFFCRERFYAGDEAGWGAQIMENTEAGLVLFLDVDLSPDEIAIDFAKVHLQERKKLGTIGLWCTLHGDSLFDAGMHHLEAQFFFEDLKKDLSQDGIALMNPFSNFPYLKQAFTKGEMWKVSDKKIDKLLKEEKITKEQAEKFYHEGAIGSHLENLQRREGYKGFNKHNVSKVIKATDPRRQNGNT